jgi:hypothetical protein
LRQRCFSSRRGNAAALLLQRCCSSQQRQKAAHYATMASGSSARGNGKQGYTALQRWQVANIEILFFIFCFLLDNFKERTRERQRKKRQGFETYFPALLVGKLLPINSLLQRQLPLAAAATLAPSGNNNTLAPSGCNSTSSTNNTRSSNDNFKKLKNSSKRNLWLST